MGSVALVCSDFKTLPDLEVLKAALLLLPAASDSADHF